MSLESSEKQPLLASLPQESDEPEPSLTQLREDAARAQRRYMKAWSKATNKRPARVVIYLTSTFLALIFVSYVLLYFMAVLTEDEGMARAVKVPLEAHIMSKCPDARDCLREMILPAMVNVSNKVDFRLSYIGSITDHDDGVLCKHGPQECLGNIIELCAAKLYPNPIIYLGFTMCLTKNFQDIPKQDLVEDCALEHGISFDKLNTCATEDDGQPSMELLQDSFRRSADANVSTSCTIRVDEEVFCVRDGGKWKDCPGGTKPIDLIEKINDLYEA